METRRSSQEATAALGQGPGSASRDTQNSVFELLETKTPNKWKMSAFFLPEKIRVMITSISSSREHLRTDEKTPRSLSGDP